MHLHLLAVLGQGSEPALSGNLNLLVGLILGLPLLGFLLNGALALWQPRAKAAVSVIGAGVLIGSFVAAVARLPATGSGLARGPRGRADRDLLELAPGRRPQGGFLLPARSLCRW